MKTGSAKGGHFAILPILSLLVIRIVIEDLYEISILVSLYVTKSSLPLVLSVDLP